ncbi:MAG: CHAD domain-containing protein [Pirellulales bacterium]
MSDHRRTDRSHENRIEPRIESSKHLRWRANEEGRQPNSGKWIDFPSMEMAAVDVAYEALHLRLEHVQRMLPLAAYQHAENLEHVHQLRVGCRRAATALSTFRPLLGHKNKPLKRWLQDLRSAAGPARDLDVLLLELHQESATGGARLKYIIEPFQRRRKKLQRRLVKVAKRALLKNQTGCLQQAITQCLQSIADEGHANRVPFAAFARQILPESARPMLSLSHDLPPYKGQGIAPAKLPKIERLHELRIAVKRFRYSIELFHSVFPTSLRDSMYPQLKDIQQRLGALNDHATMQKNFQWLMAKEIPDNRVIDLAARIVQQHEAVMDGRLSFLEWWTPEQADAFHAELEMLLSDQATKQTTAE